MKNDKRNERCCSSCPSQPKFVEETSSFSHSKHSRTPFDLYWNNYYKKHAEEMDYDVVPVKEDYNCEPKNSGPIGHQPAGTIHYVPSFDACEPFSTDEPHLNSRYRLGDMVMSENFQNDMIPIIFRPHLYGGKGEVDELFSILTLEILCKNNLNTLVYLIDIDGNLKNFTKDLQRKYDNLKYYNYEFFSKSQEILNIEKNYKHLSSNKIELELNGILSFFYINKFVDDNKLDNFYIIENDVIVNCDLNDIIKKFNFKINKTNVYLSNMCILGVSICNKEYLNFYISTIIKCYNTHNILTRMEGIYNDMKKNGRHGGISDMAFNNWINNNDWGLNPEKKFEILNFNQYTDNFIIDSNFADKKLKLGEKKDNIIIFNMKKKKISNRYKRKYVVEHSFYKHSSYFDNDIVKYKNYKIKDKKIFYKNKEVLITHFGGASKALIPLFYKLLI
jgi:hypothetical protein